MTNGAVPPRKSLRRIEHPANYVPAKRVLKYLTDGERKEARKDSKKRWYTRRKKTVRIWDQERRQRKKAMSPSNWSSPMPEARPAPRSPRSPLPPSSPDPSTPTISSSPVALQEALSGHGANTDGMVAEISKQHSTSAVENESWKTYLPATMALIWSASPELITRACRVEALREDLLDQLFPSPSTWEEQLALSQCIKDNVQGAAVRMETITAAVGHILTACEKARSFANMYKAFAEDSATQDELDHLLDCIEEVSHGYIGLCNYARLGSAYSACVLDRPSPEDVRRISPH